MFQEIMRGELLANGDDTRLRTLPDELGIPPLGYDDKATAMSKVRWRSMPQHSSPAPFNPVTCFFSLISKAADKLAQTSARAKRVRSSEPIPYDESDTGGWGLGPEAKISELDLPGGSSYCELEVFDGLPTKEEFALLIDRNQPVLFRGGAKDWRIRELWKRHNFLTKYGARETTTTFIPYGQLFDVTDKSVSVPMRVEEYVDSWGQEEEKLETLGAPRYMFSTEFAERNPDLMDDLNDLTELLSDYDFLGRQFFLGAANTGAPMHWWVCSNPVTC